jgi:hypothetical protein
MVGELMKKILAILLLAFATTAKADLYAQIDTNTDLVLNLVIADPSDTFSSSYTWDDVTNVNPQPQDGWTYVSPGVYTSSAPPPTLASQQALMSSQVSADAEAYVTSYYDLFTLQSFFMLQQNATATGKTNRAAYIAPLASWFLSIVAYTASIQASIAAASDLTTVNAITWNFSTYASPGITLVGALAISN